MQNQTILLGLMYFVSNALCLAIVMRNKKMQISFNEGSKTDKFYKVYVALMFMTPIMVYVFIHIVIKKIIKGFIWLRDQG